MSEGDRTRFVEAMEQRAREGARTIPFWDTDYDREPLLPLDDFHASGVEVVQSPDGRCTVSWTWHRDNESGTANATFEGVRDVKEHGDFALVAMRPNRSSGVYRLYVGKHFLSTDPQEQYKVWDILLYPAGVWRVEANHFTGGGSESLG